MQRKYWLIIFNGLTIIFFIGFLGFNQPLWSKILGLVIMLSWMLAYPFVPKRKKKEPPK